MSEPHPWWPLNWGTVDVVEKIGGRARHTRTLRCDQKEVTVTLPNAKRFTVFDCTAKGEGYVIFAVDAWGGNTSEPTEHVPDILALRCFLMAEADSPA